MDECTGGSADGVREQEAVDRAGLTLTVLFEDQFSFFTLVLVLSSPSVFATLSVKEVVEHSASQGRK